MANTTKSMTTEQTRAVSMDNPTSSHDGPITFGVEIEAVLAFDQEQLQSVLNRYYNGAPQIVKSFPDSAHDCFLQENDFSHQCRNLYPSWVLQVSSEPGLDTSLQVVGQQSTSITGRPGKVRKYLAEPLIIAQEALEHTGIPIDIKAQLRRNAETILLDNQTSKQVILRTQSTDYQRWTLTTDHTLIGSVEQQLQQAIGDQAFQYTTITDPDGTTRVAREKRWDSSGLELVSPIFTYENKSLAFTNISEVLSNLTNSGQRHKLLSSTWASLQVHIGLDIQNDPLHILQHLAFILITQEDLLSKLHPRSRCGLPLKQVKKSSPENHSALTSQDTTTSQDGLGDDNYNDDDDDEDFDPEAPLPPPPSAATLAQEDELYLQQNNTRVLTAERGYTGSTTTASNALYFSHTTSSPTHPPTQTHTATHVFSPTLTLPDLIALLQKPSLDPASAANGHRYRGYMYNFDNLLTLYREETDTWKTGKPTVEFRQHACSTDPEEVRRWVELCFAIVRFATRMAGREPGPEEEGVPGWEVQAAKYGGASWSGMTIDRFLGEEGLGIEEHEDIRYWVGRYELYKDDRPIEEEVDNDVV